MSSFVKAARFLVLQRWPCRRRRCRSAQVAAGEVEVGANRYRSDQVSHPSEPRSSKALHSAQGCLPQLFEVKVNVKSCMGSMQKTDRQQFEARHKPE